MGDAAVGAAACFPWVRCHLLCAVQSPPRPLSAQRTLSCAHMCPRPVTASVLSYLPDKAAGRATTDKRLFLLLLCFLLRLPSTVLGTEEQTLGFENC